MAHELVYTSATRGLREGTSGFCTVAMTRGFVQTLVPRLEAIGGYRPGPQGNGPVALSFWRLETAQGVVCVLSRVAPAAPDHTQRSNKLATYLVLAGDELEDAGPAWLLRSVRMRDSWTGPPGWIEEAVAIPPSPPMGAVHCTHWQQACGDAGWAGVLASAFLRDMGKPAHIVYSAGTDVLALVEEASRLLPPWARWRATFSTYFLQPVAGAPCCWRFCLDGTPAADAARAGKALLIDLTRPLGDAPESRHVRAARSGVLEASESDQEQLAASASMRAPIGNETQSVGVAGAHGMSAASDQLELEPIDHPRAPTWATRVAARSRGGEQSTREEESAASGARRPRMSAALLGVLVTTFTVVCVIILVWALAPPRAGPVVHRPAAPPGPVSPVAAPVAQATPVQEPATSPRDTVRPDAQPPSAPPSAHAGGASTTAPSAPPIVPPISPPSAQPTAQPSLPSQPAVPDESAAEAPPIVDSAAPLATPNTAAHAALPWVVLSFDAGALNTISASGRAAAGISAVSAQFAPPPHLQQLGVVQQDGTLAFPNGAGLARVQLKEREVEVVVPAVTNATEGMSSFVRMGANAKAAEYVRAVLRRVPIELFDANGVLLGRARVGGPMELVPQTLSAPLRVAMQMSEPALRFATFRQSHGVRERLDSAECVPGETRALKGVRGDVTVEFDQKGDAFIIRPQPKVDEVGVERAQKSADVKLWGERVSAARTLRKRIEGTSVSDKDIATALAVVKASLTDDEAKLVRGTAKQERSIEDVDALRELLPTYFERCDSGLKKAQEELRAVPPDGAAPESAVVVDVEAQDGLVLYTIFPDGRPR